jgi:hypothetical protein
VPHTCCGSGSATLGALRFAELLAAAELGARTAGLDLPALIALALAEFERVQAEFREMQALSAAAGAGGMP